MLVWDFLNLFDLQFPLSPIHCHGWNNSALCKLHRRSVTLLTNFFVCVLGCRVWLWFRVKFKERWFHAFTVICHKFIYNSIIFFFQGYNSARHVIVIFITLVLLLITEPICTVNKYIWACSDVKERVWVEVKKGIYINFGRKEEVCVKSLWNWKPLRILFVSK